jgi:HTH-type transcriptional regulator/antitoxin HigA
MTKQYTFAPDYLVHPGDTLKEVLDERGLSQADLSLRTGMAEKTISQIVNGVAPISHETAGKFELVTGVPASFWNQRELRYREGLARLDEVQKLSVDVKWLEEIPVSELVSRGCVESTKDKADLVRRVLQFFGVSSVNAWRDTWTLPAAQYRGGDSQEKRPGYVAAWLRMGEISAASIECQPFSAGEFRRALIEIRGLSITPASHWKSQIRQLCASAGVCFVLTKEIPRASLSGAARWISKDKAFIQLSLKYKSDDQFWFSFFHEVGHILIHGKRQVFVDYGMKDNSEEEREANQFAREMLIPSKFDHLLPHLRSKVKIRQFADSIGVSPGIVVGRLQKDKFLKPSFYNDLKKKYEWA